MNGAGAGPSIDFAFDLNVSRSGEVSMVGKDTDGFPSYEIWVYRDGQEPQRLYYRSQGGFWNALRLIGTRGDVTKDKQ